MIVIAIIFIVIMALFCYALCVISSQIEHDYEEDWKLYRETEKGKKRWKRTSKQKS